MKPFLLLVLVWAGCASVAAAQQLVPAPKKEFLDSTFTVLPSAAGAHYYRETVYTD